MARRISSATAERRLGVIRVKAALFDMRRLSASIGRVNGKTLTLVGRDVQEAAKRGIGQVAPKLTGAGRRASRAGEIQEITGGLYVDATRYGQGKPRQPGKPVKSWGPNRWMYRDIVAYMDSARGTVVVGPYKAPWLNQLHEFGGTLVQTLYRQGVGTAYRALQEKRRTGKQPFDSNGRPESGSIIWSHRGFRHSRKWEKTTLTRSVNVPARPYMQGAAGVQRAMAKANRWFRDTFYPRRAA